MRFSPARFTNRFLTDRPLRGAVGSAVKIIADFDLSDGSTLFTDTAGTIPANVSDPVGRVVSTNGEHFFETSDAGITRTANGLSFSAVDSALVNTSLVSTMANFNFIITFDLTPTDFSNRVFWTLDTNPETQFVREFFTGTNRLRSQSSLGSLDTDLTATAGDSLVLSSAYADGLYSVWENGILVREDTVQDLSTITTPTRFTVGSDINGLDDERFEFLGEIRRITIGDLT